jgi:hypothetical protein
MNMPSISTNVNEHLFLPEQEIPTVLNGKELVPGPKDFVRWFFRIKDSPQI